MFLDLVRADLLLAQRYAYYARWFAVCRRESEAERCRQKLEAIFDRLEKLYSKWQIDAAPGAGSTDCVQSSSIGPGA